jgi:hypothetical protein
MLSRLAAVTLACLSAATAHAEPRVVERIVAVVDGRPVLLSEVEAARRITGDDAAAALDGLIDELLMFAEASRLPQAVVGPEEESAARAGLAARAPGFSDEEALRRMARRQATILKYVDFRFRPQVRVAEEAVAEAARARGAGGEEGGVEQARRALEAEDLDRRIEAWVAELRQAARLRFNPAGNAPSSR